ncbi:MAG: LLM class F420-dependent oxidoreductase [Ilumatobacteraceae bacterium]
MKFGLAFASSVAIGHDDAIDVCRHAAAAGFESLWGGEHVVMPSSIGSRYPYTADGKIPATPETPIPDPLIWLAFAAAAAPGLSLGTCILILPQRNPVVLAKELATLDRLCGGRVELGIGVGWMQEEFDALGVPWARRGARTDEYVAAMRLLWGGPEVEFHGEFVDFDRVTCSPRPEAGHIPIIVGGDTDAAISRAVRLGDGWFPGEADPDRLGVLVERFHRAADEAGRDPGEIELHANLRAPHGSIDEMHARIGRLGELGVRRVMISAFGFAGPGGLDRMEAFGRQVISTI